MLEPILGFLNMKFVLIDDFSNILYPFVKHMIMNVQKCIHQTHRYTIQVKSNAPFLPQKLNTDFLFSDQQRWNSLGLFAVNTNPHAIQTSSTVFSFKFTHVQQVLSLREFHQQQVLHMQIFDCHITALVQIIPESLRSWIIFE